MVVFRCIHNRRKLPARVRASIDEYGEDPRHPAVSRPRLGIGSSALTVSTST